MNIFNDYILNIGRLKSNVEKIKRTIGGGVKFCAVVKGNAYGIGLETVCRAIAEMVDFFAVACIKEAVRLRSVDSDSKILILGIVDSADLEYCADNNISVSFSNIGQVKECVQICKKSINIHLQINTGLNRFGFRSLTEFKKAIDLIRSQNIVKLEGIYTHFATKSEDILFIKKQYFKFIQFKKMCKDDSLICHVSNSYATLNNQIYHMDMVRCGYLMYGGMSPCIETLPTVSIESKIINIHNVKKGDTIGYSKTFTATKSMKIGVVSVGYADGLDRRLSNKFSVLIGGKFCKIVGLVCMDVFMVDISDVDCKQYDKVVILGNQGRNKITLQDYADILNTSPYEVLLKFNYSRMNFVVIE